MCGVTTLSLFHAKVKSLYSQSTEVLPRETLSIAITVAEL